MELRVAAWLVFATVSGLTQALQAQSAGESVITALTGARHDAIRSLAEVVNGLQIDARTTVHDFATSTSTIQTRLDAFVRAARPTVEEILPDGGARVVVVLRKADLERILGRRVDWSEAEISATGMAVGVRPKGVGSVPSVIVQRLPPVLEQETTRATPPSPGLVRITGRAVGSPDLPVAQRRLNALQGARVDAYRRLAQYVGGLEIHAGTTLRMSATESDVVKSRVDAFLRGAAIESERMLVDGSAEVVIAIDVSTLLRQLR